MSRIALVFEKQWLHALALAILFAGIARLVDVDIARAGQLWGVATPVWIWSAAILAAAHQVYVWIVWRTELHAGWPSRVLGVFAFPAYAIGFSILGISRVALVFILAASNRDTVPFDPLVLKSLAVLTLMPALYLFYSVKRYFGFRRAFGIDHFDARYRAIPFVRQGIFRYTRNGMYVFGFFLLWVPALWFGSVAAFCVALFNHLYIWAHYYATELPDIKRIYGYPRRY
jgi:hypothetical protein